MDDLSLINGIELAVTTERLGANFYKTLAKRFKENAEISELFSILAKDEEAHEAQFKTLLKKVPAGEEAEKRSGISAPYGCRDVGIFYGRGRPHERYRQDQDSRRCVCSRLRA